MLKMSISNSQIAIAGRVLEGETEKAISGAVVKITNMPERFKRILSLKALEYGSLWPKKSDRLDRKITASDGSFCFVDLPEGEYVLETFLPNSGNQYSKGKITVNVDPPINGKITTKMRDILLMST